VAIIDGSGVLYDPAGLDRAELVRLAKARKPIQEFSPSKLGSEGYRVLVDEQDIHLPSELALLVEARLWTLTGIRR
jgi:glutamate dehydrogenase